MKYIPRIHQISHFVVLKGCHILDTFLFSWLLRMDSSYPQPIAQIPADSCDNHIKPCSVSTSLASTCNGIFIQYFHLFSKNLKNTKGSISYTKFSRLCIIPEIPCSFKGAIISILMTCAIFEPFFYVFILFFKFIY